MMLGVPQGSVIGLIIFLLQMADLLRLIENHGLQQHLHADDTYIYGFCRPGPIDQVQSRVPERIGDVAL
jgi:hypothetical protein